METDRDGGKVFDDSINKLSRLIKTFDFGVNAFYENVKDY